MEDMVILLSTNSGAEKVGAESGSQSFCCLAECKYRLIGWTDKDLKDV